MLWQRPLVQEHSIQLDLQARQKKYYDVRSRSLPGLVAGDTVHMQTWEGWKPATVLCKREEPRSYNVQSPKGQIFRRNRHHLRKICMHDLEQTTLSCVNEESTIRTTSGRTVRSPVRFKNYSTYWQTLNWWYMPFKLIWLWLSFCGRTRYIMIHDCKHRRKTHKRQTQNFLQPQFWKI